MRFADPEEVRPLGTTFALSPVVLLLAGNIVDELLDPGHPELAFFAAWAMQSRHGPKAREVVERALEITQSLPAPLRDAQERAIHNVLSERLRALLKETAMKLDEIPEHPDAREARLAMRRVLDRAEARGEARGKALGEAEALLVLLQARGLAVSDEQRARVLSCTDLLTLEGWVRHATTAATADEVLA